MEKMKTAREMFEKLGYKYSKYEEEIMELEKEDK